MTMFKLALFMSTNPTLKEINYILEAWTRYVLSIYAELRLEALALKRLYQINQSINQSNVYITIMPGEARLSGVTDESEFNSKIDETVP